MHTKNLFITLSTLLLLASTTLDAKTPKEPCSTSVECDAMAEDLQGKIDMLEAKSFKSLSKEERIKYDHLTDKLLAVKNVQVAQTNAKLAQAKAKTAEAKAKTAEQRKIIAQEKAKQAQEKAKQEKYEKLLGELKTIESALKQKSTK